MTLVQHDLYMLEVSFADERPLLIVTGTVKEGQFQPTWAAVVDTPTPILVEPGPYEIWEQVDFFVDPIDPFGVVTASSVSSIRQRRRREAAAC